MANLEQYAELGRSPVPGGEGPSGVPAAELDAYEAIREHTNRDGRPGDPPDWEKVVELATAILKDQSKDFATGTYLAVGLLRTVGPPGLSAGLGVLEQMVDAHWETGFPPVKRMRGRANAFAWLAERATAALEGTEIAPSEKEAVQSSLQHVQSLSKLLDERMGDADPQLGGLVRTLKDIVERIAADEPEPAPEPAQAPESKGESQPAAAAQPAPPRPAPAAPAAAQTAGALESKSDAQNWMLKLASFYREQEPASPLAFQLLRMARWSAVQALPPPNAEGRTEIIGPAPERVNGLRQVAQGGDWQTLLGGAEDAFRERPFWLDAQRYVVQALDGLGPAYEAARGAVVAELRILLGRVPTLPDLVFKDGTKAADEGTREWLGEVLSEASGAGGAGAVVSTTAPVDQDPAIAEAHQKGLELAKKGEIGPAMQLRSEASRGDDSPRGRFLMRLDWCRYCMNASREQIALPLLDALDAEIVEYSLDRWEPGLAVETMSLLYRCLRRLAEQASPKDPKADKSAAEALTTRAQEVFARLCQIDPVAASALG